MSRSDVLQGATIAILVVIAILQMVEINATNSAAEAASTAGFTASTLSDVTVPVRITNQDPIAVDATVSNKMSEPLTGPNELPLAGQTSHIQPLRVQIQSAYDPTRYVEAL